VVVSLRQFVPTICFQQLLVRIVITLELLSYWHLHIDNVTYKIIDIW